MKGRTPIPTAQKALAGNPGRRPPNSGEPKPSAWIQTDPPRWLDNDAMIIWHEMAPVLDEQMQVLTEADVISFAVLCDRVAEYRRLAMDLRDNGKTQETINRKGGSMVRARPEVAQFNEVFRQVRAMLADFGMSPAARTRVQMALPFKGNDPLSDFMGRTG